MNGRWCPRAMVVMACMLMVSCAVNPVTGERELMRVSDAQAVAIGEAQYLPAQQMQGGAYLSDAELSDYVNRVGQQLALASGVDLPYEFVVLNNPVPNAWAMPGGKIAVNRGLLTALRSEAELAAVLGHEIAHAAARHGAKRMERGLLTQAVMVGAAIGVSGRDYGQELLGGAQFAASLIGQKYSRDAEREADLYGTRFMAKAGYDPSGAVALQETFVALSGASRASWMEGLLASHPASEERLENNRSLVQQLRLQGYTNGRFGTSDYSAATARLRSAGAAFSAYEEALGSFEQASYDEALVQVNKALGLDNRQAMFHGLRGAIRYQQARYDDALINFNRAVGLDSKFFLHYLRRGLTHAKLADKPRAKADLSESVRLLPTASAYQALGQLAEAEGDLTAAKAYYAQAGESAGAQGKAARLSLMRLELPAQPSKYLQAQVISDESGRARVQLRNRAEFAVQQVVVQVGYLAVGGPGEVILRFDYLAPQAVVRRSLPEKYAMVQITRANVQSARLAP